MTPDKTLTAFAAACPLAVIAIDDQRRVHLWNSAAEKLFGWSEPEVLHGLLPTAGLASDLLSQHSSDLRSEWRTKSGETVEIAIHPSPWFGSDGAACGAVLLIRNLAEARQSEEEHSRLKAQVEKAREEAMDAMRFRALLEAAPDAIVKVDRAGKIVLMNKATESLFGYSREELLGQPVEILVPEALRESHVKQRNAYWHNPVTRPMGVGLTLKAVRKDGSEFPVEISLSPLETEKEIRAVAIIRDVTERKRIEQELQAMELRFAEELREKNVELERRNREIERADRLKSEFLASMSHELRTPLHTVIGFSQLLSEEIQGPLNEKQRRFVSHIYRDSQHLLELINDILDLSKIESGKVELHPEPFDAGAELHSVMDSIRASADAKSIAVELNMDRDVTLNADKVRFREVLFNLLGNALKFTPAGGSVTVSAAAADRPDMCAFRVEDTGIGIPPDQIEAIFDKFHQVGSTTKGVREGTGLGLTITRHIVEMHGGRISVESQPGKGSRFTFTMPRA